MYEAVDPEIQRRVALKVLRRDLLSDNPELLQRLFVEARAANAIGHPGVVQISEAKLLPEGSGYLVMELLEGVTLTQRLRRAGGRLQLAEALPLAIQVASALRAGHQRGIVHRELMQEIFPSQSIHYIFGGKAGGRTQQWSYFWLRLSIEYFWFYSFA